MSHRSEHLESLLVRRLSELIPTLSDPRIPVVVTVERVKLAPDLTSARVLVSALGDDESLRKLEQALNGARGHLQREIGRDLKTRRTPVLSFTTNPL
jgi:ribosome-binding factor A